MTDKKHCEHGEDCESCHDAKGILKGISSRMISLSKIYASKIKKTEPGVANPVEPTPHLNNYEPRPVGAKHIPTPAPMLSITTPDALTSCGGCGYMHKSLNDCPRCSFVKASNKEAVPFWRR